MGPPGLTPPGLGAALLFAVGLPVAPVFGFVATVGIHGFANLLGP